jgi:hypothetical protein
MAASIIVAKPEDIRALRLMMRSVMNDAAP